MQDYFVPAIRAFVQLLFLYSLEAHPKKIELPGNDQDLAQIILI